MKKLLSHRKRGVILLLALCTVAFSLPVGRAGYAEEAAVDTTVQEYLAALQVIDGVQADDAWYQDSMLRGEVALLSCGMLNALELANAADAEKVFADVEPGSLNAQYIGYVNRMGLVCGSGGNFYPKEKITYAEFVKIMIGVLGYKPEAEAEGGYPTGYLKVANRVGILDGGYQPDAYLTRESAYRMAAKALEADCMDYTGGTADSSNFQVTEGGTLLARYHGIRIEKGVVTANRHTSLFSADGVGEANIKLDEKRYRTTAANADMFLGYAVKAYINTDDTVVYLAESENDTVSVLAKEISDATTKRQLVYDRTEEAAKTSKAAIAENASVIYNERYAAKAYTNLIADSDLKPKAGNVVLVDNNGDRQYDVVFISAYDTFVVDSATEAGMKIHLKNGKEPIDCADEEVYITDQSGNPVSLASIAEWNVLAVAKAKDNKLVSIIVLNRSVTGTLAELSEDYLKIDDTEYPISKSFDDSAYKTELGKRGVFYLDIENAVAAIDYPISSELYGYLIKADLTGTFDGSLSLKVFTENNDVKVFGCTKHILYNKYSDHQRLTPAELYQLISDRGESQFIKYVLDESGAIKELQLAAQGENQDAFSLGYRGDSAHYVVGMINYRYFIPDTVKIFSVPEDKSDEDAYFIAAKKNLTGDKKYDKIELYDIDENNFAGAVVMNLGDAVDSAERGFVVDEVLREMDADGQTRITLAGYSSGQNTTLTFAEDDIATLSEGVWGYDGVKCSELRCGDVIQVTKNARGEVNKFRLLFRPDPKVGYMYKNGTETTNTSKESFKHTAVMAVYAKVVRKSAKAVIYDPEHEKVVNLQNLKTTPVVYVYDAKEKTPLRVGQLSDIEVGDSILVLYNWSSVRELFVYRY